MAFISNKLTHWVGSNKSPDEQYQLLVDEIIPKKRLLFNHCDWAFRAKYGGMKKDGWSIPMVCFTDIPLSQAPETLCKRYSHFGVTFEKVYLANCLACPVGYVQNRFVHENFSKIFHKLSGVTGALNDFIIPEGVHQGQKLDVHDLLGKFMFIMAFKSDYSRDEFRYNETREDPLPGQEEFFEQDDALYFEREWRMVLSSSGTDPQWILRDANRTYFKFKEQYVPYVIVPRRYKRSLTERRAEIFKDYDQNNIPTVIAYEDLRHM